ncbi:hypothetical protein AB0D42_20455 [Streptomyces sp. NPDC048304]|uniref:hypothetical protein n=1 Tax=Streptomyces sp. NPDC048304 TaxID=3154820 RepID=UPI00340739F3
MTTPPDPDHTPLFDVDAPVPLTPVERLLALADLYTQHNDRIDLLFAGRASHDPDAYVSSARRLERETLASIKAVRQQRLPAIEPVTSAVVRLKQIAYLTSGATRYLTAAQQALPEGDAEPARPDPRRGLGQYLRLARELTALAPAAVVESTTHIAARLPERARSNTTVPGMDATQRGTLLEVARGHVIVTEQYGQRGYGHTVTVDIDVLRHLEDQNLVTREPASAPPFFPGGPLRDRVRLTSLGLSVLSTVINSPLHLGLAAARPVPAPAAAATTTRVRR